MILQKFLLFFILVINYNCLPNGFLRTFGGPITRTILFFKDIEKMENERIQAAKKIEKERIHEKDPSKNYSNIVDPKNIKEDFNSVIINDDIKDNFNKILHYLKNPNQFKEFGAKLPKGVLLYGPPGTGKTSLGRALAKEAGCKFIYLGGSELDDMWVGTGAKKIKEIFDLAKENSPSIIFIDEINTIGKKRSGFENRFHQQTLQQFLIELDGFVKDDKSVIVIGTTNSIEQLDEALLRSGRFDMHLKIDYPNYENRKKIFRKFLSKVKVSNDINDEYLSEICKKLHNFSGADIENIVNQASLNAIMSKKKYLTREDLNKVIF